MSEQPVALKPCPFCGTTEHLSVSPCGSMTADMPARPHRVVCFHIDHDEVAGPVGYGQFEAIAAWNTRPTVPVLDAMVEAMAIAESAYSAGNLVTNDGYYEFDLDAAATVIAEAMAAKDSLLQAFMEENPPLTNAALRSELAAKDAELAELRAEIEKYKTSS